MDYAQAYQYEPPVRLRKGGLGRLGHIKVCTDYNEDRLEQENDEMLQLDATYLAINYAYCPTEVQKRLNFDTSGGQKLLM